MDILAVVAVPFIIALLLTLPGIRNLMTKSVQTWGIPVVMLVLAGLLLSNFPQIQAEGAVVPPPIPWVPDLGLNVTFYLDGLSLMFGLVVTIIGAIIFWYTGFYFDDAAKQTRFNLWLSAFAGAMLGLVLSGNLILMFIMWELTSITSFMLIGFYGDKDESARVSARRALIITGGGGLTLIAGVVLMGGAIGQTLQAASDGATGDAVAAETIESDIEVATQDTNDQSLVFDLDNERVLPFTFEYTDMLAVDTLADHPWYIAIAVLLMLSAFTKSAQFPFHFWLPGAMSAPTPASAFLHSATMVKAGVYLLARIHPVMYANPFWTQVVLSVGLITMFISAVFALKQRDLKGLLAYSTTSWLGVLVALIGLPSFNGFKALAIGIMAHALYKSALFLSVGSVDHSVDTRNLDKLGGLRKYMPATMIVVIISALSMAGVPLLFGFVAKEVLLDASVNYMNATFLGVSATYFVAIAAAFTGTAGYILIWDVFFGKPKSDLHYHAMPPLTVAGPMILAVGGTFLLPFLLDPLIIPLVQTVTPKEFELHLIPTGGFANPYFQISLLAIAGGLVIFAVRRIFIGEWQFLPFNGQQAYAGVIASIDWFADQLIRSQNGRIRYYLFYILGVVAVILVSPPTLQTLAQNSILDALRAPNFRANDILTVMLLVLAIGAAISSIVIKRHLIAAFALGIFGYAVAGIYIVGYAPDVALVQFMVETLATVMIIVMISRISHRQRKKVADELWTSSKAGIWRDALIAVGIGVSVTLFTLTALLNRPERTTIAQWYVENTEELIGVPDVVAAILTDFRGTDTFIEIGVFAIASLGILSLLALNRKEEGVDVLPDNPDERIETIPLSTPFTRTVGYLMFPLALLIAFIHLFYGAIAPGDGFTAGIVGGLALALGYVVFGYYPMRDRIAWLRPLQFLSAGLMIGILNAVFPILLGQEWMAHLAWKSFDFAGLKIATTVVFEIAIALTVFGSVGIILEAIAHPRDVEVLTGDESYDPNYEPDATSAVPVQRQPQGGD